MPPHRPPPALNEWLLNICTCQACQRFAYFVAAFDIYKKPVRMYLETVTAVKRCTIYSQYLCVIPKLQKQDFRWFSPFVCVNTRNDLAAQIHKVFSNICDQESILQLLVADYTLNVFIENHWKDSSLHSLPLI